MKIRSRQSPTMMSTTTTMAMTMTGQGVDVHSAADIYFSAGMDEDQMFGYSHDELQKAFDS